LFAKQLPGLAEPVAIPGAEEAEISNLDETFGQNMLEETANELLSSDGANPGLACVGFGVAKCDLPMGQLEDTLVTDGHPKDVRSQILQGSHPIADRLTVNDPILLPGFRRYLGKQISLLQSITELGPKKDGQRFDMNQKIFPGWQPTLTVITQTATRDQIMHMGMVIQVATPGMQDANHSDLTADKARVLSQLLCGCCRSPKEKIVDRSLVTPGKLS
jgi:hypothetical protein